jgi:hypothetical protein
MVDTRINDTAPADDRPEGPEAPLSSCVDSLSRRVKAVESTMAILEDGFIQCCTRLYLLEDMSDKIHSKMSTNEDVSNLQTVIDGKFESRKESAGKNRTRIDAGIKSRKESFESGKADHSSFDDLKYITTAFKDFRKFAIAVLSGIAIYAIVHAISPLLK